MIVMTDYGDLKSAAVTPGERTEGENTADSVSSPGRPVFSLGMAGMAAVAAVLWNMEAAGGVRGTVFWIVPYVLFWAHGFFFTKSFLGRWGLICYAGFTVLVFQANVADLFHSSWRCGNSLVGTVLLAHFVSAVLIALDFSSICKKVIAKV